MSYVKLDIENLQEIRERIRRVYLEQDRGIAEIRDRVEVRQGKHRRTRKLFAVDSGFNTAYETSFVVFKAAVVDEEMEVDQSEGVYFFHVDNYKTQRLRRLLMQQVMYEALFKTVEAGVADSSLVLVDGTLTLAVFYPTPKDGKEYRKHFHSFYQKLYSQLVEQCLKRNIILLGFLKRTGSTYLAKNLGISGLYDVYVMNSVLRANGQHIPPIPVVDSQAERAGIHHNYVTFYLNLKEWNYRFELLKQQEDLSSECVKNLLFWATEAHCGMNPVFSKADEHARVSKREANLKFNHIIHDLPTDEQIRLRMEARKRSHFGYRSGRLPRKLVEGKRGLDG